MEDKKKVECLNCGWIGNLEELISVQKEFESDEGGVWKEVVEVCPKCQSVAWEEMDTLYRLGDNMKDFEIALLWCTECREIIGLIITKLEDTGESGRHYWFKNEVRLGTKSISSPDNNYQYYLCPNCKKGHILFWCPTAKDAMVKLNYDPYLQPSRAVSNQDTNDFREWLLKE